MATKMMLRDGSRLMIMIGMAGHGTRCWEQRKERDGDVLGHLVIHFMAWQVRRSGDEHASAV